MGRQTLDIRLGRYSSGLRCFAVFLLVSCAIGLSACSGQSSAPDAASKFSTRVIVGNRPIPKGGGIFKVGTPYQIGGSWYYPKENRNYDQAGIASWYGEKFHGRRTSNGEIYDMNALTAAHPTLPMPTYARVTNLVNGRTLVVRINDRGPYKKNRIIDLSRRSAQLLGFKGKGTSLVRVKFLGRAPLNGDDSRERQYLASRSWSPWVDRENRRQVSSHQKTTVGTVSWTTATSARVDSDEFSSTPVKAVQQSIKPTAYDYFVLAASFRESKNAEHFRDALNSYGSTQIKTVQSGGSVVYQVRLGPYRDIGSANDAMKRIVDAGAKGAKIDLN